MSAQSYYQHYKANLQIAGPIVAGQLGVMATSLVDTAMVGQVGKVPLAAASLANSCFYLLVLLVIGAAVGITPLVGKALGEKDHREISAILKNSFFFYGLYGGVIAVLMFLLAPVLGHLDQPDETVVEAIPYFEILCLSVFPWTLFLVFQQFTEGLAITLPAMGINLGSNLVNVVLNYMLIFGHWGAPAMGLEGAGWATLISRILMMVVMFIYLFRARSVRQYVKEAWQTKISAPLIARMVKLGTPIALQQIFELGAFTVGAIMVGWHGSDEQAAHHIALMVVATTYRMATGVASTATVRISRFLGERDTFGISRAAYSNMILVVAFMGVCTLIMIFWGEPITQIFSQDAGVVKSAAALVFIAAFFQLFDGIQAVALGALRGLHDVKVPTFIAVIAYWVIMMPLCYYLSEMKEMGATGVWIGFVVGLFLTSVLLYIRYEWKSRHVIEEINRADLPA